MQERTFLNDTGLIQRTTVGKTISLDVSTSKSNIKPCESYAFDMKLQKAIKKLDELKERKNINMSSKDYSKYSKMLKSSRKKDDLIMFIEKPISCANDLRILFSKNWTTKKKG